jgi:hypothetical protein
LAFVKNLRRDLRALRARPDFPCFSCIRAERLGISPYRESGSNRRENFSIRKNPLWRAGESTYAEFPTIDSRNLHYSLTIFFGVDTRQNKRWGFKNAKHIELRP